MSDAGETVADLLVTFLNGESYSLAFVATNPEDPQRELDLVGAAVLVEGLRVFVVPTGETRERLDKAAVKVTTTVNIFISRVRKKEVTKKALNELTSEILDSLDYIDMGTHTWEASETVSKYDVEKLEVQDRFLSVLGISYYDVV